MSLKLGQIGMRWKRGLSIWRDLGIYILGFRVDRLYYFDESIYTKRFSRIIVCSFIIVSYLF